MAGWPKNPGPERVSRRAYPYDLTNVLGCLRGGVHFIEYLDQGNVEARAKGRNVKIAIAL